jgi:hypothetical protein
VSLTPSDAAFWRRLRPGTRLLVRPQPAGAERPRAARSREVEIVSARLLAVADEEGELRSEYLLFDLRAGDAFHTLVVTIADGRLLIRVCGVLEGGGAPSREELAQRGFDWLLESGGEGLRYARYPVVPVVEGGRERRIPFAATSPAPLRGEYAPAKSDRAAAFLIMEYAALEQCEEPALLVLEEVDTARVTVLSGSPMDPRQFER